MSTDEEEPAAANVGATEEEEEDPDAKFQEEGEEEPEGGEPPHEVDELHKDPDATKDEDDDEDEDPYGDFVNPMDIDNLNDIPADLKLWNLAAALAQFGQAGALFYFSSYVPSLVCVCQCVCNLASTESSPL